MQMYLAKCASDKRLIYRLYRYFKNPKYQEGNNLIKN